MQPNNIVETSNENFAIFCMLAVIALLLVGVVFLKIIEIFFNPKNRFK